MMHWWQIPGRTCLDFWCSALWEEALMMKTSLLFFFRNVSSVSTYHSISAQKLTVTQLPLSLLVTVPWFFFWMLWMILDKVFWLCVYNSQSEVSDLMLRTPSPLLYSWSVCSLLSSRLKYLNTIGWITMACGTDMDDAWRTLSFHLSIRIIKHPVFCMDIHRSNLKFVPYIHSH